MFTSDTSKKRKKVNFMINENILIEIKEWISDGDRSDFVNVALQHAVQRLKRERACDLMDELREKAKIKMSIKEIIKRKNYGRP